MSVSLEITFENGTTQVVTVVKPAVVVGRSRACDVQVGSDVVSSKHAIIRFSGHTAVLEDLGSTNGTFVNGTPVAGSVQFGPGDTVQLGAGGPVLRIRGDAAANAAHGAQRQPITSGNRLLIFGCLAGCLTMFVLFVIAGGATALLLVVSRSGRTVDSIVSNKDELQQSVAFLAAGIKGIRVADGEPVILPLGTGTGFVVTPDGYLFTNRHVVESIVAFQRTGILTIGEQRLTKQQLESGPLVSVSGEIRAVLGGKEYEARVVHVSRKYDFAVLKIDAENLPYFRLASRDEAPLGRDAYALGFPGVARKPLSREQELSNQIKESRASDQVVDLFSSSAFSVVVTKGVVGRVSREEATGITWIAHDVEIRPGNSGGPLCLADGTVVGINTYIYHESEVATIYYSFSIAQLKSELPPIDGLRWTRP